MDDDSVIVSELETGRLIQVQMDGKKDVVAELGGSANGAAIGPDGMMYVCNGGGLNMVEVEGKLTGRSLGRKKPCITERSRLRRADGL